MKKKLLALLLSGAMILSLTTPVALAEEPEGECCGACDQVECVCPPEEAPCEVCGEIECVCEKIEELPEEDVPAADLPVVEAPVETPVETAPAAVTCEVCGEETCVCVQVGDVIWITSGSLVYKDHTNSDQGGYRLLGNYRVKVRNIIEDENGDPAWYEFKFVTAGIGEGLLALSGYKYVQVENTVEEEPEENPGTVLTDTESGVAVAGEIPKNVELSVESATIEEVAAYAPELAELENFENPYKVFDISMLQGKSVWQPGEDETVSVTMDAEGLGEDGDDVLVYHVHVNEDESVETELLGPFAIENGTVEFEMSKFSYVLVFSGTAEYTISNIATFYPASLGGSGNGHYQFLGIYYDTDGDTHFLLATVDFPPKNVTKWFVEFYIDGKPFVVAESNVVPHTATYTKVEFKDETGKILDTVPITEKGNTALGFFDVNIGDVDVAKNFGFKVSDKLNREPDKSNGWNICDTVTVDLDYELIKTVAAGTSAEGSFGESVTVNRGEWVIFKVEVNNLGSRPLTDMLVQDILPADVFDMGTVQMSIDGTDGAIGNWQTFNSTLFSDYDSEGGFSRQLYVKAQVLPDLKITDDTTYTNKATIDGMNMPTYEDTASVVVKAPTSGTLTVSKAVTSANPMDPAPKDAEFTFKIESAAAATSFQYAVNGVGGTVANGGTFTLKNGESAVFAGFPKGSFTVTEVDNAGYTTKVNGQSGTVYSGEMEGDGAPVVAFENQFSFRTGALRITKKVEKEYSNDSIPADHSEYSFTVEFIDGNDTPGTYDYTINAVPGTITSGGIITLKAGQTAEIDFPVGVKYTITENLGGWKDDYVVKVGGVETNTVSGTVPVGGAAVTFTNIYKKHLANLTITKIVTGEEKPDQNFRFLVSGPDNLNMIVDIRAEAFVNGSDSVTIKDLSQGTYTVTEDTSWAWRYELAKDEEAQKPVTVDNDGGKVTFTNVRTEDQWLDGETWCRNNFDISGETAGKVDGTATIEPKKEETDEENT